MVDVLRLTYATLEQVIFALKYDSHHIDECGKQSRERGPNVEPVLEHVG